MTFYRDAADTAFAAKVAVGPLKIFASFHAIPLIRRVCFGNKVGNACGDLGISPLFFFPNGGNGFGHLGRNRCVIGIDGPRGSVELDSVVAFGEENPSRATRKARCVDEFLGSVGRGRFHDGRRGLDRGHRSAAAHL